MVLNMLINLTLQSRFMVLVMVMALQLQMCDVSVFVLFLMKWCTYSSIGGTSLHVSVHVYLFSWLSAERCTGYERAGSGIIVKLLIKQRLLMPTIFQAPTSCKN